MIEQREKEIDGVVYRWMPMMAKAARNELDKLIQKFGPTFGTAIKGLQNAGEFDAESEDGILSALPAVAGSVGSAIEAFCHALTPEYHANLVRTFIVGRVKRVTDEGEQVLTADVCETVFATALMLETKILVWCLEEQYADFFALLRKGMTLAALSRAAKKASPSAYRKSSIGTSTESPQVKDTPIAS